MADNQACNMRMTRARAAKAAANCSATDSKPSPCAPTANTRSKLKRAATEDPDVAGTKTTAETVKRRAVLTDLTNANVIVVGDSSAVPKNPNAADRPATGKVRGRAASQSKIQSMQHESKDKDAKVPSSDSNNVILTDEVSFESDKENKPERQSPSVSDSSERLNTVTRTKLVKLHEDSSHGKVPLQDMTARENTIGEPSILEMHTSRLYKIVLKGKGIIEIGQPKLKPAKDVNWSPNFVDIDSDYGDPQMCTTYAPDIYANLRFIEIKRRPLTNFMDTVQHDINAHMRSILVDWLVEVSEEYKLVPDTLYLTVTYIDRFLSANAVQRQQLQLVGVTCMLVAAKYEEICAPHVEEFCYITDNTYTKEEVLSMEIKILNYFQYNLTTPTTKTFLRRFIRAAQASCKVSSLHLEFMGNYLAELTLLEYDFLKYLPSLIAASAVFMARLTLDPSARPWNTTLQHYSGYKASDMKDCVCAIHELQLNKRGSTLTAVREKYRQHKFKCVANLVPPQAIDPTFFKEIDF